MLPISKRLKRIHVGGRGADDIGMQCGGWTITWQGKSGGVTTGRTTVLQAIRNTAIRSTNITFATDSNGAEGADVGIVVIGETPYAEFFGDTTDLALDAADIHAVGNMKKARMPVVAVLLSGRPMIIDEVLAGADGFIVAWLPGTEGQGVADVLFGDYRPTGRLSFSWPRSVSQVPINVGDARYDPLFKYGFGQSY